MPGESSSIIVAVACCEALSVPLATELMSTITVSFKSTNASFTPVTVMFPFILPAAMVIELAEAV